MTPLCCIRCRMAIPLGSWHWLLLPGVACSGCSNGGSVGAVGIAFTREAAYRLSGIAPPTQGALDLEA